MSKINTNYLALIGAVLFQFFILSGMVGVSAMPLWTGEEIKVKTQPVDPRSLFRGNYARLGYAFSRFESGSLKDQKINGGEVKRGTIVYVALKTTGEGGMYEYDAWSLQKPNDGKFLRGRVTNHRCIKSCRLSVKYGIEAYFAPKEKALALEGELRDGGVAVLMVSKGGKARIKEIVTASSGS